MTFLCHDLKVLLTLQNENRNRDCGGKKEIRWNLKRLRMLSLIFKGISKTIFRTVIPKPWKTSHFSYSILHMNKYVFPVIYLLHFLCSLWSKVLHRHPSIHLHLQFESIWRVRWVNLYFLPECRPGYIPHTHSCGLEKQCCKNERVHTVVAGKLSITWSKLGQESVVLCMHRRH